MTFAAPWMLAGLAAVSVPVIIHLLNRRRHKVIRWGAMRFLRSAVVETSRRLRLLHILLMLLRMAALAILALALARPRSASFASLGGTAPHGTALILLDLSGSAGAGGSGPREGRPLRAIREQADRLLDALPLGEEITLFALTDAGIRRLHDGVLFDPARAKRIVAEAEVSPGRADARKGIGAAIEHLKQGTRPPPHRVFLVTDGQALTWRPDERAAWEALAGADPKALPEVAAFLTDPPEAESVSLDRIETGRPLLARGETATVRVRVANRGRAERARLPVALAADGKPRGIEEVTLKAGDSAEVEFPVRFDAAGDHVLEASIPADELPFDDRRFLVVPVAEGIPVLVADGGPSPQPMAGEADFCAAALASDPDPEGASLFRPRVVPAGGIDAPSLKGAAVAILANVASLSDRESSALRAFVESGGGLLVALGGRTDPEAWNRLAPPSPGALLPCRVAGLSEPLPPGGKKAVSPAAAALSHAVFAGLDKAFREDLGAVEISRHVRLEEPSSEEASVAARLETKTPWIVEGRFGRGRVIAMGTALSPVESDLPVHGNAFVPLIVNLAGYLARGGEGGRSLLPGQPIAAPAAAWAAGAPPSIADPAGKRHPLARRPAERGRPDAAEFLGTDRAGIYRLEGLPGGPRLFAVNPDPAEADLAALPSGGREAIAKAFPVRFGAPDRPLGEEREVGRMLLSILALVLLLEVFVTGWMTGRERRAAPSAARPRWKAPEKAEAAA